MLFELILFLMFGAVCGTHELKRDQGECSNDTRINQCQRDGIYGRIVYERGYYKRQKDPDSTYGPCI